MNLRPVVACTAALCGVCVVYLAFVRTSPSVAEEARAEYRREQQDLMEQGKREFAKVAVQPVAELSSREQVTTMLVPLVQAAGELQAPTGAGPHSDLISRVGDFLHQRFVNPSAEEYRAWRAREGYQEIPIVEMFGQVLPPGAYTYYTGKPQPDAAGTTLAGVFAELWAASMSRPGAKLVGLAKDQRGQVVRFGELNKLNPNRREPAGGLIPAEVWVGKRNMSLPSWYRMPMSIDDHIKKHGRVVYAEVGIIAEFDGNVRYPMVFTYFWDEDGKAWRLAYLNFYNTDQVKGFVY